MKEAFATPFFLALFFIGGLLTLSSVTLPANTQLAQVSGSSGATTTSPGIGNLPVSFSVSPPSGLTCSTLGARRTVGFFTSPVTGGYFSLYGPGGVDLGDRQPGLHDLPPGTYTWEGKAIAGYTRSGSYTGNFLIDGVCPTSAATTTSAPGTIPSPDLSLIPATFSVNVAPLCTSEKSGTLVAVEINPSNAGTIMLTKAGVGVVNSALRGLQYLPNGEYSWIATVNPGFRTTSQTQGVFSFSDCPLIAAPIVTVGDGCDKVEEGVPVRFGSIPESPVTFSVTNTKTGEVIPTKTGTEYFPNGEYSWKAIPPSGIAMRLSGVDRGNFTVWQCGQSGVPYTPPEAGTILLFRNGKLANEAIFRGTEGITMRIDVPNAKSVSMESIESATGVKRKIGEMIKQLNTNTWLLQYNANIFPNSSVNPTMDILVVATAIMNDGRKFTAGSRKITLVISSGGREGGENFIPPLASEPEDLPDYEHLPIPEPVFTEDQFGKDIPESSPLPIRGLGDLITTQDILSAEEALPEGIQNPIELRVFCADSAHDEVCLRLIPESLRDEATQVIHEARTEMTRVFLERPTGGALVDTDQDGLSNYDEERFYGTNSASGDTDGDGINDQLELLRQESPLLKPMEGVIEKIQFENPNIGGVENQDLLAVEAIEVKEKVTVGEKEEIKSLVLSGRALPGSIVSIYLYSDPIIISVKADKDGLWSHTITQELPDGSHKAYVAMTDSAGRILAKSAPLPFVKQAAAVTVSPSALPGVGNKPPSLLSGGSLYAFVIILLGVIGFAVLAIGLVIRSRQTDDVVH